MPPCLRLMTTTARRSPGTKASRRYEDAIPFSSSSMTRRSAFPGALGTSALTRPILVPVPREDGLEPVLSGPVVVSRDPDDLDDDPAVPAPLQVNEKPDRLGDCHANGRVGQLDPALQHAAREPPQGAPGRVGVDRRERAGMTRVERLQEVERLASPDLPQDDAVGPVPQGRPDQVPDRDGRQAGLL